MPIIRNSTPFGLYLLYASLNTGALSLEQGHHDAIKVITRGLPLKLSSVTEPPFIRFKLNEGADVPTLAVGSLSLGPLQPVKTISSKPVSSNANKKCIGESENRGIGEQFSPFLRFSLSPFLLTPGS